MSKRNVKHYAIQVDENTVRMMHTVARDIVMLNADGSLTYNKWPPEGAIEIEREPKKNETLKISKGKAIYTEIDKGLEAPTIEDRIKAIEDKLK